MLSLEGNGCILSRRHPEQNKEKGEKENVHVLIDTKMCLSKIGHMLNCEHIVL